MRGDTRHKWREDFLAEALAVLHEPQPQITLTRAHLLALRDHLEAKADKVRLAGMILESSHP